ncbi:MAG: acyl-CoA/acyl-ACP dehydrogenase [Deltaproteobacteria bacterium]|nr:MAG: acyl-CoA/acyl-ACP dehydrogenase [Deltaproteobacteria bacterium]
MDFAFTEEQEELRSTARSFLAEHSGSEQVRTAMESQLGYDPQVWKQIGSELGWTAVTIPEAYGGLGLTYVELIALLEVMGESLLCAPFFSSVCLASNALLVAGSESQKQEHLPGIAEGQTRATLAFTEAGGAWDASGIEAQARSDGGDFVLSGRKSFVLDGHCADLLVVAARAEGSRGEEGIELFLVPADAQGLLRRALPTLDPTRRLADVELSDVRVPAEARLGEAGGGWPALSKTLDLACVALAAEQVGGAQKCLDMSVAYAKERVQFGRPIGSFQAIKHKCADMMVEVESARSASYYAGCVAAEDGADLPLVAALAKAYCSDAYFRCAADAIQIHGGVGFTWEYDVHLYFKRAKSTETFLGDAIYHRERLAQKIGL